MVILKAVNINEPYNNKCVCGRITNINKSSCMLHIDYLIKIFTYN